MSSSFLALSLLSGTDCKNLILMTPKTISVFYSSESEACLSSCLQEEPSPGAPDVSGPVDDEEETEEEVHSCGRTRFSTEERRSIGGAIERLGLQLLEKLPIGPQQPNVILSPLSVAFALAQLTLGQSHFNLVLT